MEEFEIESVDIIFKNGSVERIFNLPKNKDIDLYIQENKIENILSYTINRLNINYNGELRIVVDCSRNSRAKDIIENFKYIKNGRV